MSRSAVAMATNMASITSVMTGYILVFIMYTSHGMTLKMT
jgi:hypothetical protein